MENGDRFPRIKRKNDRRCVPPSQYYRNTQSVRKRKIFLLARSNIFGGSNYDSLKKSCDY